MSEKSVICLHSEVVNSATHIGKCKICGQQKLYDPEHPGKFTIVKRGRIDGKLTEITPPKKVSSVPVKKNPRKIIGRAKPVVEAERVAKEPESAPFRTGPLNKRLGIRAIWRF